LETLFEQGRIALKENNYSKAEKIWQQIVQLSPENVEALTNLCDLLIRNKKPEQGLAQCQKAVELDPKHAKAYGILGRALRRSQKFDESINAYRQAIQLEPHNLDFYRGLAYTFEYAGRTDEAIPFYHQAIALPNKDLEGKAAIYSHLGLAKQAEAIKLILQAIPIEETFPGDDSSHFDRSSIDRAISDGIVAYRHAIELDPEGDQYYNSWVDLLKILQAKSQDRADAPGLLAIADLRQRVEQDPKNSFPWFYLGKLLTNERRFDEAEIAFRQFIELYPEGNKALLSQTLLYSGKTSEAQEILESELKNPYSDNWIAYAYRQLGQLDQAEAAARRVLKLNPQSVQYHDTLGDMLVSAGKWTEAEAIYRQGLDLKAFSPKLNLSLQTGLAVVLREQGKLSEALAAHHQALAMPAQETGINPYVAEAYKDYGDTLKAQGELRKAVAAYEISTQIDPAAENYLSLGDSLVAQKRFSHAIEAYRQATKLLPWHDSAYTLARNDAIAYNRIGQILRTQGKILEATEHFTLAVEADPSYAEATANLKAIKQRSEGTQIDPNQTSIPADLQRLLGRMWVREKTEEYPHQIIINLTNNSEISIVSTENNLESNYFFPFELQETDGQRFIFTLGAYRGYAISKINYSLDRNQDLFLIKSGNVYDHSLGGHIELKGEYKPWFPTSPNMSPLKCNC
jgi:tetratricopeptide (TPR) repeat protein